MVGSRSRSCIVLIIVLINRLRVSYSGIMPACHVGDEGSIPSTRFMKNILDKLKNLADSFNGRTPA